MRKIYLAVLALTCCAAGGTAPTGLSAEPAAPPGDVPGNTPDWSGPYLGLTLADGSLTNWFTDGRTEEVTAIGVLAGQTWQAGPVWLGAEAEWHRVEVATDGRIDNDVFRLKARAGVSTGRALPYVMAGVARARTDLIADHADGTVYGVGVDVRVGARTIVGIEAARHDLDLFETEVDTLNLRFLRQF